MLLYAYVFAVCCLFGAFACVFVGYFCGVSGDGVRACSCSYCFHDIIIGTECANLVCVCARARVNNELIYFHSLVCFFVGEGGGWGVGALFVCVSLLCWKPPENTTQRETRHIDTNNPKIPKILLNASSIASCMRRKNWVRTKIGLHLWPEYVAVEYILRAALAMVFFPASKFQMERCASDSRMRLIWNWIVCRAMREVPRFGLSHHSTHTIYTHKRILMKGWCGHGSQCN